ncbi:MAG: anti-sigma factor antagonist [Ignavibacteriae bacterium]|nr:MAG: anti-sigma factor antagonist [Ignavibacteriota bacterium]
MEFKTKEIKGITVVELKGNVMGGPDASALNDFLHQLITEQKNHVVVDLKSVSFINSSGLGMLIGGLTTMRHSGGELKLARASKKVENLLEMTKLLKVFDLHKNVNNAIASFK